MRNFKKILTVLLTLVVLMTACAILVACGDKSNDTAVTFVKASQSEDGYATVYAPDDRDIKIMVLSDPQVDVYEKYKAVGSPGNDKTYSFVKDFVTATDPDLVIINGDLVMNDMPLKSSTET